VLSEERSKVGLALLTPMMNDDLFGIKLQQIQAATPDDKPEDAVAVFGCELP